MSKITGSKQRLKFLANIFYYTVLTVLVLIILLIVFSHESWSGNYRILVVQSGSMEPAIHTGAVVVVKPQSDYTIGDIVTYRPNSHNKQTITHRIQSQKDKNGQTVYITKGDANEDVDFSPVSRAQLVGKVIVNVPYVGYAVAAAKTKWGFLLVIILPVLIIVADQFKKIVKEIKKIKIEKSNDN